MKAARQDRRGRRGRTAGRGALARGLALVIGLAAISVSGSAQAEPAGDPAAPATAAAPSEPPEPPEYRPLATEGFAEFEHGNYPEALALFERAYAVHPSPRMLRAIAKCLFELRRYADAVVACDRALAADRDALGVGLRADVTELRARAIGFTGTAHLVAAPAAANVSVDGRRVTLGEGGADLRIDLGRHVVEASAPGREPLRRELVVDAGRRVELRLDLVPIASASAHDGRSGAYALLGVGGAVAAGALVTSALWFLDRSRAVDACNEAAARGARCENGSSVATQKDLSIAAVVVSSALLAGTVTAFVLLARGHSAPAATALSGRAAAGWSW